MANSDKKNITSFKIGDKAAEVYTLDVTTALFEKMLDYTISDNDILCMNDACKSVSIRPSGLDYLLKKFPKLEYYKKDIQNEITSRINKGGLRGIYNPTTSIWRMKMLGEQEITKSENKNEHSGSISIDPKKWTD